MPCLVRKLLTDRANQAVHMTELETENEELQEAARQARSERDAAVLELVVSQSHEDALEKVVRDVCKGHTPTDVMWVKMQPPRPRV